MRIETFFDFCSGIGGGRLGLEKCGLKCVGYADTSRLSSTTYNLMHNTTGETNYGNIKRIKSEKLPHFDLLICGFPCQSFSVIGTKKGLDDSRGELINYVAKIIKDTKPTCFILENVKGLVNHKKGQTLKTILAILDKSGYRVDYKILDSWDYGVPQSRKRIYFIGVRKVLVKSFKKFKWPEPIERPQLVKYLTFKNIIRETEIPYLRNYLNNRINQGKYTIEDLSSFDNTIIDTRMNDLRLFPNRCPTLRSQRDGLLYSRNGVLYELSGEDALLLQGFPLELVKKVTGVVSERHILMQAGNAMTVTTIESIGKSLLSFLEVIK